MSNPNNRTQTSTQIRNFYSEGMSYLNMKFYNTNLSFQFYPFTGKDQNGRSTYDTKNGETTTVNFEGAFTLWKAAKDIIDGKAGLLLILSVIILYIWQMTLNWVLSAILEAVCVIGCVTAYFVKPGLFENLLSNLLGKLAFADVFTGITQNHIVDLSGIVLYLSVITVFIFLTVQTIQKRRWS